MAKVRIEAKGVNGVVYVDGQKIRGVCGYNVTHTAEDVPRVEIQVVADELDMALEDAFIKEAPLDIQEGRES